MTSPQRARRAGAVRHEVSDLANIFTKPEQLSLLVGVIGLGMVGIGYCVESKGLWQTNVYSMQLLASLTSFFVAFPAVVLFLGRFETLSSAGKPARWRVALTSLCLGLGFMVGGFSWFSAGHWSENPWQLQMWTNLAAFWFGLSALSLVIVPTRSRVERARVVLKLAEQARFGLDYLERRIDRSLLTELDSQGFVSQKAMLGQKVAHIKEILYRTLVVDPGYDTVALYEAVRNDLGPAYSLDLNAWADLAELENELEAPVWRELADVGQAILARSASEMVAAWVAFGDVASNRRTGRNSLFVWPPSELGIAALRDELAAVAEVFIALEEVVDAAEELRTTLET